MPGLRCPLAYSRTLVSMAVAAALLPSHAIAQAASDSAAVAAAVTAFHQALAKGDTATVLRVLAADALVLESGDVENREHYVAHHLPADMAFLRAVTTLSGPIRVVVVGDVAWATSSTAVTGRYEGRAIDSQGVELVVLSRDPDGWRIRAIHWSSRARRGQ